MSGPSPALPSAGPAGPRLQSAGRKQQHMKPGPLQPHTRQPNSHFPTLTKQKGVLRKTAWHRYEAPGGGLAYLRRRDGAAFLCKA